jgi:hypothetical protein
MAALTAKQLSTLPEWLRIAMGIDASSSDASFGYQYEPDNIAPQANAAPQINTAIFDQGSGYNTLTGGSGNDNLTGGASPSGSIGGMFGDVTDDIANYLDDSLSGIADIPGNISEGWTSLQNDPEAFAAEALGYSEGMTGDEHFSNSMANVGMVGRGLMGLLGKSNPVTAIASAIFSGFETNAANKAFPHAEPLGFFEGLFSFQSPHEQARNNQLAELTAFNLNDPLHSSHTTGKGLGQSQFNSVNEEPIDEQNDPLDSNTGFDTFGLDLSSIGTVTDGFGNPVRSRNSTTGLLGRGIPDISHLSQIDSFRASKMINEQLARVAESEAAAATMADVNATTHGFYSDVMDDESGFTGVDTDSGNGYGNDGDTGPGSGPEGSGGQGNI